MVHFGQAQRQLIMDAAYLAHPERFVRKAPVVNPFPEKGWINKPDSSTPAERKTHSMISPSVSKFLTRSGWSPRLCQTGADMPFAPRVPVESPAEHRGSGRVFGTWIELHLSVRTRRTDSRSSDVVPGGTVAQPDRAGDRTYASVGHPRWGRVVFPLPRCATPVFTRTWHWPMLYGTVAHASESSPKRSCINGFERPMHDLNTRGTTASRRPAFIDSFGPCRGRRAPLSNDWRGASDYGKTRLAAEITDWTGAADQHSALRR